MSKNPPSGTLICGEHTFCSDTRNSAHKILIVVVVVVGGGGGSLNCGCILIYCVCVSVDDDVKTKPLNEKLGQLG